MKSLKFFKPTLATTLAIVLAWLVSVPPAQAGYTVTLQEVGPDVVATGSGVIDLTGLTFAGSTTTVGSEIRPWNNPFVILTGPATATSADLYNAGNWSGPLAFGCCSGRLASSGSGDLVGVGGGVHYLGRFFEPAVYVPLGYVSGNPLSDSATYNDATFATLGVTPGTYYVWTWGPGANQNFTLIIGTPTPPPDTVATPSISPNGGKFRRQVVVTLMDATPGVAIYYTLDGSDPTTLSNVYINPFMLRRSATVKAIAVDSNFNHSAIATASFIVRRR